MRRHPKSVRALVALVLSAAMVAAACSGGDITVEPARTPAPESTATPAPDATPDAATPDTDGDTDPESAVPPFPEPDPDPTPIEADPAVRIGVLDNGLTYYVRSNGAPGDALELRLAVDAGSLQQMGGDEGSAHFLEHMMFNGTEKYPANTLEDILNSFGAVIGPDLNAYTTFDETVYILSLPRTDQATIDIGFDVLREWAGNATLDPDEVVKERGVVLEEFRLSENDPAGDVNRAFLDLYFAGTDYEDADPIGTADRILDTDQDRLRQFYDDWYRPDLMAVVAVGDVDVDELEQYVIDGFSDLEDRGSTPPRVEPSVPLIDEPRARTIVDPAQANRFISLDFTLPVWDSDTVGGERLEIIESLIATMIETRLAESAGTGRSELIDPFVGAISTVRNQRILGFNTDAPDLAEGLRFVLTELHRLRVTGFEQAELDRAIAGFRAGLDATSSTQGTTQHYEFADTYVAGYLSGVELSAIDDAVDRIGATLDAIDTTAVNDHYRWVMANAAPLAVLVGTDADQGIPSETDLLELMDAARIEGLTTAAVAGDDITEVTTLIDAPEPAPVVESGRIDDPDARYWTFENGVTVVFAESDISAGALSLQASSSGGWSLLDPGDAEVAAIATEAVIASGVGDISRVALDRFLSDSTVSLAPYIDETREGFFGGATVADLEELLQLLHLYVTEPGVDAAGFRQAIATAEDQLRFADTDPFSVLIEGLFDARYGSDAYQNADVTSDDLEELTPDRLLALYESRLGHVDDTVVVIVGDADADTVEDLAATYLGTLPRGPSDDWIDVKPPAPDGVTERSVVGGNTDGAAGLALLYEAETDVVVDTHVTARVLATIIDERLFVEIREDLGATYGGSASVFPEYEPDEGVAALVLVEGDPGRIDLIRQVALGALADIAANGVRTDEFDRAVAVVQADYDFISNGEIVQSLIDLYERPDEPTVTFGTRFDAISGLRPADVNALAALLFGDGDHVEVVRTAG